MCSAFYELFAKYVITKSVWTYENGLYEQGWHFVYFWGRTCTPNVQCCNPNVHLQPQYSFPLDGYSDESIILIQTELRTGGVSWESWEKLKEDWLKWGRLTMLWQGRRSCCMEWNELKIVLAPSKLCCLSMNPCWSLIRTRNIVVSK